MLDAGGLEDGGVVVVVDGGVGRWLVWLGFVLWLAELVGSADGVSDEVAGADWLGAL